MSQPKFYFAGSIRGGRNDADLYREIIRYLQNFGEVLTEHIGNVDISENGETALTDREIYNRDLDWLTSSDIIVAEVTNPSLGVGFEIAKAIDLKKKVLCLYRKQEGKRLSAMISGCGEVMVKEYEKAEEIPGIIDDFLNFC